MTSILDDVLSRDADRRCRTADDGDDSVPGWTTATRQGVTLRIPPAVNAGATITLGAYRRWETEQTTTMKGSAA